MFNHWVRCPVRRGFDEVRPVFEAAEGHGWIAGSYAAFMAADNPIPPNDIDVFARSTWDAERIARRLSRSRFDMDENATAFSIHRRKPALSIQVVKPAPGWSNFPWDIINNFDLDVCRALLLTPTRIIADENVGRREAKVLRVNNPLRSLKRVLKYHVRGVEFNDHELLKLFRAWEELSPDRREAMLETARQEAFPAMQLDSGFWGGDPDGYSYDDDWFDGE